MVVESSVRQFSATPQNVPSGIRQYFLPAPLSFGQTFQKWKKQHPQLPEVLKVEHKLLYKPVLFAQAQVHIARPELNISHQNAFCYEVDDVPISGVVKWENWRARPYDPAQILVRPYTEALYIQPSDTLLDVQLLRSLHQPFFEHVLSVARFRLPALPALNMIGHPGESFANFQRRVLQYAGEKRDDQHNVLRRHYEDKLEHIKSEYRRVTSRIDLEYGDEGGNNWAQWGESVMDMLRGNFLRGVFEFFTVREEAQRENPANIIKASEAAESQAEIDRLYKQYYEEAEAINKKWARLTSNFTEEVIVPNRNEIFVEHFGLGWRPYYYARLNNNEWTILSV